MTKEKLLGLIGEFTWSFSTEFFIETNEGNFIWKDPNYGGDNTIQSTTKTYIEWLKDKNIPFARSKGKHFIGQYIGSGSSTHPLQYISLPE